jgi:hypothetical protein
MSVAAAAYCPCCNRRAAVMLCLQSLIDLPFPERIATLAFFRPVVSK